MPNKIFDTKYAPTNASYSQEQSPFDESFTLLTVVSTEWPSISSTIHKWASGINSQMKINIAQIFFSLPQNAILVAWCFSAIDANSNGQW